MRGPTAAVQLRLQRIARKRSSAPASAQGPATGQWGAWGSGRRGLAVASRDTDGLLLVASPHGGTVELDDGQEAGAISWEALDEIMRRFDGLAPFGVGVPFFKRPLREHQGRPLHGVVLRVKRYALGTLDHHGDLAELVEATEHGLGGQVVDPPMMGGRAADGRHHWTRAVAAEVMRQAIPRRRGERHMVERWPWDEGSPEPFPQIQRCQAATPEALAHVEEVYGLRLRPFGLYLQGTSAPPLGTRSAPPVAALDPGGPLDDWQAGPVWHGQDRQPQPVTTDVAKQYRAHLLRSVDDKALAWMVPRRLPVRPVVVDDPRFIRKVGRGGRLVEARAAGDDETPSGELRVEYPSPDVRPVIVERVRAMGPAAFANAFGVPLDTATRWSNGQRLPSARWVRELLPLLGQDRARQCALDRCEHPVSSRHATYCTCPDHPPHRWAAQKRRQRAGRQRGPA